MFKLDTTTMNSHIECDICHVRPDSKEYETLSEAELNLPTIGWLTVWKSALEHRHYCPKCYADGLGKYKHYKILGTNVIDPISMSDENKVILFRELSRRLPYNTFVKVYPTTRYNEPKILTAVVANKGNLMAQAGYLCMLKSIDSFTPYLRRLTSMTEDESNEIKALSVKSHEKFSTIISEVEEFYFQHHLDYNHLIDKGLSLEAPKDMYKF